MPRCRRCYCWRTKEESWCQGERSGSQHFNHDIVQDEQKAPDLIALNPQVDAKTTLWAGIKYDADLKDKAAKKEDLLLKMDTTA